MAMVQVVTSVVTTRNKSRNSRNKRPAAAPKVRRTGMYIENPVPQPPSLCRPRRREPNEHLPNNLKTSLNHQLSTLNSQLSTLNSQLSTLNSQLSTLNSQLSSSPGFSP